MNKPLQTKVEQSPPIRGKRRVERGSACALLVAACLVFFGAFSFVHGQQQLIVNGGRVIIQNGGALIMNNGVVVTPHSPNQVARPPLPAPVGDMLHFLDGSTLHGQLTQIQNGKVVRWKNPAALNELEFNIQGLDYIRFAQSTPVKAKPGYLFQFVNGDELIANLTSIDADEIGLEAWFSSATKVPRSAVQSITFLSTNFVIAYEGPYNPEGWSINPPGGWDYRDGVFSSRGNGSISRDFGLTGSCTVEFDMTSPNMFSLWVNLYADKNVSTYGYIPMSKSNSYGFIMNPEGVELRRGQMILAGSSLGRTSWPAAAKKNKVHITIQSNKAEKTVALFADHQLVKRWNDTNPEFAISGGEVVFADISGRPGLKLNNFRVSRWEGIEPQDTALTVTNVDRVSFVNRDRAGGTIVGTTNGQVQLIVGARRLDIPLQRIKQLSFALTNTPAPASENARAYLNGYGRVSFQLEQWNTNEFSGRSAIFGPLTLRAQSVRQVEFNPGLNRDKPSTLSNDEFGGLDE